MNYAERITEHLGGDWFGKYGLAPGPGHSWRDRSLKISLRRGNPNDIVVHSYIGDDVLALKQEWREKGLLPRGSNKSGFLKTRNQAEVAIQQKRDEADDAERIRVARWLWSKSKPANEVVRAYLRSRGIELATRPQAIRFLPANPPKHPYPAMIVPFGLPDETEPSAYVMPPERIQGVHLTWLERDGSGKAPVPKNEQRGVKGRPKGFPLALIPPNDGFALLVAEGVETALSAALPNGLGAWAAGCAPMMPPLADAVPSFIETVWIWRERDRSGAGQRGADELKRRLKTRGIETFVVEADHD